MALATAIGPTRSQRQVPAVSVINLLNSSGGASLCKVLNTIAKGPVGSGSPVGTTVGVLKNTQVNLIRIINFVGRSTSVAKLASLSYFIYLGRIA